jgi:putative OPT family oligopeptide transporter
MAETTGKLPYKPYVSADKTMSEFTIQAVLIGLVMCVVLGAANAYLGLKAGMTIAATYPAAVIGMAILRILKGSILEENIARTVGSIGESVAAGAIFTIPAFLISGVWNQFYTVTHYLESFAIMAVGGIIGVLFVTILRRVMVEDVSLPFPESVAAGEIHKAGRAGGTGAIYLFLAMILGGLIKALRELKLFASQWEHFIPFKSLPISKISSGNLTSTATAQTGGGALLSTPGISPAYMGVGYIIGPVLSALNFTGGLLAWGLFVPLLLYFIGPSLELASPPSGDVSFQALWSAKAVLVWKSFVRPIAIGGMLMSAFYTLYRMRKSLIGGMKRSIGDVKKAATGAVAQERTERDIPFKWVLIGIVLAGIFTLFVYQHFAQDWKAAIVATIVMLVAGFFFAAVSGYLVGLIGSSNNPISGLTISSLIVAALLMVLLGSTGTGGIAAVLGVAAVVCVSAAVAGEMLQDLKVGHILGGTPWKMQVGDLIGVVIAAAVMFIPLFILHEGDIKMGGQGFGGTAYPAPQASLMAIISRGIVAREMAWPLVIVGIIMGIGFILLRVKSPMLVCVGMYLPLETSFAIFIGGLIRGLYDIVAERMKFNAAQKARAENNGILLASGLIAGEALMGLVFGGMAFYYGKAENMPMIFKSPVFWPALFVFAIVALVLVVVPVRNAGRPDEPAPPSAVV